jgi:protein involved in polysaccharide export with SLBB domain
MSAASSIRSVRDAAARLLLAAVFAGLLGAASSGSAVAQARPDSGYLLGSGDRVRVTVFGHRDLSGDFTVDGSGNVSLPLVGNVKAGGLSLREFEGNIITALKPDYLKNPRVSAEVLNYRPFYIIGEVKKPGSYSYVNGMTVVNAVALAGGYTYRARENQLLIIRATDKTRTKEPANHDTVVLPGDVIEVPERFF